VAHKHDSWYLWPLKNRGKRLVVRDFIYTKEEQEQFAEALKVIPQEVVLSLKNTPHDFYPTFPDNPLIGRVGERPQWIEYDVNGQYFGWGVVPSIMFDDIEHRLAYGLDHKVSVFSCAPIGKGFRTSPASMVPTF
jgi:hypothetical protein